MALMSLKQIAFAEAAALSLLLVAPLAAQPLPQLRVEAIGGGSVFHVSNTSSQPLTALLIELVGYPGSSYTLFEDYVAAPTAPGAEKRIQVTNMTVGAVPEYVKITAALYADGSSAGDAGKAALIVGRRKSVLETTRELITRLDKAQKSGTAKDAILADLKQWADSLQGKSSRRLTQETVNQAAARMAVSDAAGYLEQHSTAETLADLHSTEHAIAGKP
jgi:hypothetical protein